MEEVSTRITVIGAGDCGNNTLSYLTSAGIRFEKTVAINTDVNALKRAKAQSYVQIGENTLRGRGAGGDIYKGRAAAEEDVDRVIDAIGDPHILIALSGLGGGTGSGALPVVLTNLKEKLPDCTTISVVALPFRYEGSERVKNAQVGLRELIVNSDCVIANMNDMLVEKYGVAPVRDAFRIMDNILVKTAMGLRDMIDPAGAVIRTDISDFKSIVHKSGLSFVGHGNHRNVKRATEIAVESKLLDADLSTAKGSLIFVEAPETASLQDASEAPRIVTDKFGIERAIWGLKLKGLLRETRVMIVAAGVQSKTVTDMIGETRALTKE